MKIVFLRDTCIYTGTTGLNNRDKLKHARIIQTTITCLLFTCQLRKRSSYTFYNWLYTLIFTNSSARLYIYNTARHLCPNYKNHTTNRLFTLNCQTLPMACPQVYINYLYYATALSLRNDSSDNIIYNTIGAYTFNFTLPSRLLLSVRTRHHQFQQMTPDFLRPAFLLRLVCRRRRIYISIREFYIYTGLFGNHFSQNLIYCLCARSILETLNRLCSLKLLIDTRVAGHQVYK